MTRNRSACLIALLVLGAAVYGVLPSRPAEPTEQNAATVLVQLAKFEKGSVPRVLTAFGRVEPGPSARQTIQAPLAAIVDQVYVKAGQEVAAGAPLVRLGPSPATTASFTQAESALRVARETERRTRSLLTQHLATAQQLADAGKAVSDAQASLDALRAEGAASPQVVKAPGPAIVTAVSASLGAIVNPGAALVDLARPGALVLRVGLTPEQAATVRAGNDVEITSLGATNAIGGHVLLRASMIDTQTGLVPVDIALPEAGGLLPGEMAEAAITTGEVEGFVVPHAAVLVDSSGATYLVQAKDGVAHRIPVRVLLAAGDRDVVAGALDGAASLVLAGNYQLEDGMRVRTTQAQSGAGQ